MDGVERQGMTGMVAGALRGHARIVMAAMPG